MKHAMVKLAARLRDRVNRAVYKSPFPPGHFYSPIPSSKEILRREASIFNTGKRELPGIALEEEKQLALLEELKAYYDELPFTHDKKEGLRYRFNNGYFSYMDAILLYAIIRHVRPKRIVEIGSGFSSALVLDTNERFFESSIRCSFIDPHPERLQSLVKDCDRTDQQIIPRCVQDVEVAFFESLSANDLLFVDSSHVSKTGSDVNYILFEILPVLGKGVLIHFHDIVYPFEYPREWLLRGRAWNEAYLLRAFLQYNPAFEVVLFNTFLKSHFRDWFRRNMPLCLKTFRDEAWYVECSSLWLRKR